MKKGRTDGADNFPITNAGSPVPAESNTVIAAGTVLIADGAGATNAMMDTASDVLIADATGASNAMTATAGDVLVADPVGAKTRWQTRPAKCSSRMPPAQATR